MEQYARMQIKVSKADEIKIICHIIPSLSNTEQMVNTRQKKPQKIPISSNPLGMRILPSFSNPFDEKKRSNQVTTTGIKPAIIST